MFKKDTKLKFYLWTVAVHSAKVFRSPMWLDAPKTMKKNELVGVEMLKAVDQFLVASVCCFGRCEMCLRLKFPSLAL